MRKLDFLNFFLLLWVAGFPGPARGNVRLVSTSPALTELLFQLGKGPDVVGTSILSDYPPEARKIPLIGSSIAPSVERIVALTPDWVLFDSAAFNPNLSRALHALGIRQASVSITSVDKLLSESDRLLRTIYPEETNARLKHYRACLETFPLPARPFHFLALAWFSPPILFGGGVFLSDLIRRLGGVGLVPQDWKIEYPQVSQEWLLARQPEIAFYTPEDPAGMDAEKNRVERWWPDGRVILRRLAPEFFSRASFTPLVHLDAIVPGTNVRELKRCFETLP